MLGPADGPIAIVVNLHMPGTPNHRDRKVGGKAETHRGAQALGPRFDRPEWRLAPVHRSHDFPHLSAPNQPGIRASILSIHMSWRHLTSHDFIEADASCQIVHSCLASILPPTRAGQEQLEQCQSSERTEKKARWSFARADCAIGMLCRSFFSPRSPH